MATLKGRRLELRPLAETDAEALFSAIEASRDSLRRRMRWVGKVASAEDCRAFIQASRQEAERGASQVYGVFETKTGALAGIVALQHLLVIPGLAEAAAWIRADRQDKGYALEAGKLLLGLAFKGDHLHRVYARIDPANRAGRKVLQRLGFHYEGCLRQEKRLNSRWINQECWGLLRSEHKK